MSIVTLFLIGGIYFSASTIADANAPQNPVTDVQPRLITASAETHTLPESTATKTAKKNGYRYENATIDGRLISVKISPSGTRWVKYQNSWYDIDANPNLVTKLPTAAKQTIKAHPVKAQAAKPATIRKITAAAPPAKPVTIPIAATEAPALTQTIAPVAALAPLAPLAPMPVSDSQLAGGYSADDYKPNFEPGMDMDEFEAQLERYIEGIIEAAPDAKSPERAQAKAAKMMRQVERNLERALADREKTMARAEQAQQQAMAQVERELAKAMAQAERAREQAERDWETREYQKERPWDNQTDESTYDEDPIRSTPSPRQGTGYILRTQLLATLRNDGLITQDTQSLELVHNGGWTRLNGNPIPRQYQRHYCKLIATYVTQGDETVKIVMTPKALDVISVSHDGTDRHHVTYGTFKHAGNVAVERPQYPSAPGTRSPLAKDVLTKT